MSAIVVITMLESLFGFLVTSLVFYLVVKQGRKNYHYLFAAFLFICILWDLGIFITMLRNEAVEELDIIGRFAVLPCVFIPALIFHFVNLYIRKPIKWAVILVWAATGLTWIPIGLGIFYKIEGYYAYGWGNIFKVVSTVFDPFIFIFWFGINLSAGWLLYKNMGKLEVPLQKRHSIYIFASLMVVTFAIVKSFVTMGVDLAFLLPLGMFLNDVCVAIIGLAIIKDRLFDITVMVKRSALYSMLAAMVIFIYSFMEHILVTFIGDKLGENSTLLHLSSIAVGIAVLMPLKNRIEKIVDRYFTSLKLEF
jgi:hypothetical protein